ncbi:hypothetical protein [Ornithinibacillus sp. FSL M8-0202]
MIKLRNLSSAIDSYFIGEPGEVGASDRVWFYSASAALPLSVIIFLIVI